MERAMTPAQVARAANVPVELIRSACRRGEGFHPLPHVRSGGKRPKVYIRPSDFETWWEEESHASR